MRPRPVGDRNAIRQSMVADVGEEAGAQRISISPPKHGGIPTGIWWNNGGHEGWGQKKL